MAPIISVPQCTDIEGCAWAVLDSEGLGKTVGPRVSWREEKHYDNVYRAIHASSLMFTPTALVFKRPRPKRGSWNTLVAPLKQRSGAPSEFGEGAQALPRSFVVSVKWMPGVGIARGALSFCYRAMN